MYLSQSKDQSVSHKKTYEDSCLEEFDNYLNKPNHMSSNKKSQREILSTNINLLNQPDKVYLSSHKSNKSNRSTKSKDENSMQETSSFKPSQATLKYEEMKKKLGTSDKDTADFLKYLDSF